MFRALRRAKRALCVWSRIASRSYGIRRNGHSAAAGTVEEQLAEEAAAAWLAAWPGGDLDAKDEAGWSALQRAAEAVGSRTVPFFRPLSRALVAPSAWPNGTLRPSPKP